MDWDAFERYLGGLTREELTGLRAELILYLYLLGYC